MKRLKVIYNPASGKKTEQAKIFRIAKLLLESDNTEISFCATKKGNDAKEAAYDACLQRYDIIIGCGGDGTIHEIVNGMVDFHISTYSKQNNENYTYESTNIENTPNDQIPALAILPAGTVNDFANYLQIPVSVEAFVKMVQKSSTKLVDVGMIGNDCFINVIAGGAFANIPHEVSNENKTILGKYAYYLQGALELGEQLEKSYPLNITADGETYQMDALMFIVANTASVGGFSKLAPHATLDDGFLDLLVIKKAPPTELVSIAQKILWGEHLSHKLVFYKQAKNILIESNKDICLDYDGEAAHTKMVDLKVLNKALRLVVP